MNRLNELSPHLPSSALYGAAWPQGRGVGAGADPAAGTLINRGKLLLGTGLYVAAFLWAYATIISPTFGNEGFTLTWPGAGAMVWLMTLALVPALLLPYSVSRPSALILWWLYLAAYIPSILVPTLSQIMPFEELLPFQITLLLCMGVLCWAAASGRLLAVPQITVSPTLFWPAFLLVWAASLGYVCMNAGVSALVNNLASLFNGATEYTLRTAYKAELLESGRGLAYVVGQLSGAFNLFLIAFGLRYRRRLCWVAGMIGQLIVFSLTGFKTALFSFLALALVAMIMRRWRRNFALALISALIAIIFVCAIADRAIGNVFFSSLITRRVLTTPGLLTGFYFDHFSKVPPVGVELPFFYDPTVMGPASEVGFIYCGGSDTVANAHLWAMGFARLGMPGIVGYTILAAFVIWIYDSLSAKRNLELAVLLVVVPAIALSSTLLTTVLISEGGLAAALLLYLSPAPQPDEAFQPEIEPVKDHLMSTAGTSV